MTQYNKSKKDDRVYVRMLLKSHAALGSSDTFDCKVDCLDVSYKNKNKRNTCSLCHDWKFGKPTEGKELSSISHTQRNNLSHDCSEENCNNFFKCHYVAGHLDLHNTCSKEVTAEIDKEQNEKLELETKKKEEREEKKQKALETANTYDRVNEMKNELQIQLLKKSAQPEDSSREQEQKDEIVDKFNAAVGLVKVPPTLPKLKRKEPPASSNNPEMIILSDSQEEEVLNAKLNAIKERRTLFAGIDQEIEEKHLDLDAVIEHLQKKRLSKKSNV